MIPNVWTVEQFKKASSKVFSRRSSQLQEVDKALARAHSLNPTTDAGADAIMAVLNAIAAWRKYKVQQGKTSDRARAVDELVKQLATAAETAYKRKVGDINMTAPWVENDTIKPVDPRASMGQIQQTLGKMMGPKPPVLPKPPIPPRPPVPTPPMPKRSVSQDRLFDVLAQAMLDQRKKAMGYDDEDLFDDLDAKQKGRLSARWMLAVPDEVKDVDAARAEALRVLAVMLGNNVEVIKNLLENKVEVVVIPRDKGMTVLDQFASIRGQLTFDGRSWDSVRGVGNVKVNVPIGQQVPVETRKGPGAIVAIDPQKARIYTAVTEENLLGGTTTAPGGGCYATGYSTTTHEFAHSVHAYGLSDSQRTTVKRAYDLRLKAGDIADWVDGPRKVGANSCYASMTVFEYFAQLSNAWLGVNFGDDPYTRMPRNNGRQWILDNEPKMMADILEAVYGQAALEDLNPAVILKS